jgi:hypothetical protein
MLLEVLLQLSDVKSSQEKLLSDAQRHAGQMLPPSPGREIGTTNPDTNSAESLVSTSPWPLRHTVSRLGSKSSLAEVVAAAQANNTADQGPSSAAPASVDPDPLYDSGAHEPEADMMARRHETDEAAHIPNRAERPLSAGRTKNAVWAEVTRVLSSDLSASRTSLSREASEPGSCNSMKSNRKRRKSRAPGDMGDAADEPRANGAANNTNSSHSSNSNNGAPNAAIVASRVERAREAASNLTRT